MGRVTILGPCHLRGTDFHSTVTLEELVEAAGRFGFSQIDLTPHLRDPANPHRLPSIPFKRLGEMWEVAKAEHATGSGRPKVQLGLEVNIVPIYYEGTILEVGIDLEPNTPLAYPTIASYHFTSREKLGWPKERDSDTCPQQDPGWMYEGYLQLLDDYVPLGLSVLGHIFEYASRAPSPGQAWWLAVTAKRAGAALEINLRRLLKIAEPTEDILQQKVLLLQPPYVDVFAQTGVSLYLGTDIHNSDELEHLENIQLIAEYLIRNGVQGAQIIGWED